MNKIGYRNVRNAKHPVPGNRHPEITQGQSSSQTRRLIAIFTLIAYIGQPLVVTAQVIADTNAAADKRPVVDNTANGLPLVQITTPNSAGLSHNQYNQFNVDSRGAILNNSRSDIQTQQGGYISGNPYLHTGSARIILNEVTGAGASQLRGYTEVAGQRAEVIIANPNGINCDGCGFINTSRGVLTTGIPVLGNSGSLDAFRVTGGQITIGAGGLNGANLDQLDLISRSLQVNGQLWANNLNAITGTNQVNYTDLGVTVIQGDANKPTVGIDVALLGGMYANKIKLIGTEAGVGVNSQGTLAAQAGDFTLDNQGHITLGGSTSASGKLSITGAAGTTHTGTLYGKQTVQITDRGDIANSGTLSAQDALNITAASLNSSGILGAGIDANGNANQNASLSVTTTGNLTATGQNLAGTDIAFTGHSINLTNSKTVAGRNTNLTATTGIDHTRGTLQTAGTLTANAGTTLTNTSGSVIANQITASAADLYSQSGQITQTGTGATTLAVSNTLDNTGGTIQTNSADLSLTPLTLKNDNGSITHVGQGKLNIITGALSNNKGIIATNGQLTAQTTTLTNRGGSIQQVGTADTVISSSGSADNTDGDIASNGLRLSLQLGRLDNTRGVIKHLGTGQLTATTGALTNAGGTLSTSGQAAITANSLDNQNGTLTSTGKTDLTVSDAISNTGGNIQSGAALNISATRLDNITGRIVSLNSDGLNIVTTGQLSNTGGGLIGGNGNATLNIGSLINSAAITAQNNLVIHADGTLDDNGGTLEAGNDLTAYAGTTFSNVGGNIRADRLSIRALDLGNRSGSIVQTGSAATTLSITNLLDNTGGTIQTNSADLSLTPQTLTNDNGTIAHAGQGILNINTGVLSNNAGNIGSNGQITLNATRIINRNGILTQSGSAQTAITSTGNADNFGGDIASNGQITFSAASLDNNAGRITSLNANGLTVSVTGQLDNSVGGLIGGNGNVILNVGDLNNSAVIFAQNDLTLSTVRTLNNSNGVLSAGRTLTATTGTTLSNTGGSISATHLGIDATDLNNRAGNITQIGANAQTVFNIRNLLDNTNGTLRSNSDNFSLTSGSYVGSNGSIAHAGQGTLNLTTGAFGNRAGNIASNGQITLNAASIDNKGGTLSAQKQAQLVSRGDIDNSASGYIGADSLTLTDSGLLNNTGGKIESNNSITLDTRNLNNTGGVIQNINSTALNITASQAITNNTGGFIGGNGQVTLNAASLDNSSSQIYGKSGLTLRSSGAIINNSGILNTQGNLDIGAGGSLSNRSGNIEAAGNSGTLLLGASSIDNTAGRIANKGTANTTLNGGSSVANYGGTIGGNGSLTLTTTSLLNSQQALLLSGNNLTLNIDNLSNNNGKIYAFSNLGFSRAGAVLDNNLGDISSSGNATYNLGVIHNNGGRITSASDIGITSGSLYGNGQIIANRDLSIGLQGDYTYASGNQIASNRDIGFSVTGTFTNQQTLQAPRNLTVNANSITNNSTFNAYNTALNASYITNNSRIDGSNITTSSYQFTNNASIIGDNIELNGYYLTNQGGSAIIAATNNINLWQSNQLSNTGGAEIYSMGNINIGANSGGARTGYVLNQSSLIDASGSIGISAVTFDNARPTIAVGSVVSSATSKTLVRPPSTTITSGGFFEQDMPGLNGTTQSFNTINGTTIHYESISAPVDVVLYSYTKVVGRTTQNATMLINKADIVSVTGSPGAYTITLTNGQRKQCEFLLKEGLYHYNVSYYPGFDPNVHIHPAELLTLAVPNTVLNEDSRTINTTVTDQVVTSAVAAQAQIRASGNININLGSTLTNYVSTIAAGNTLSISGPGGVNNQALSLTSTTDTSGTAYLSGGFSSGGFMGIGATWNARSAQIALTPTISSTSHTAYSSVMSGGNGLVIHAGVVKNNAGGSTTQITGASLGNGSNIASINSATRSSVQSANANLIANTSSAPDAIQSARIGAPGIVSERPSTDGSRIAAVNLAPVALPKLSVPTSGLYTLHRDPGHTYLVETDHRFTDYKTYTSSDYLLNRLSIDPQLAQKRLGDGFYEQKLISDQITQLTGRRFIGQYTSVEDQTRALMDNSVSTAKQLNLSTGIALSQAQAAALTQDIVWLVEEHIQLADGSSTTALVPRVYLSANHAKELTPDGALIAADTIDINSTGDLDNTGTIKSTTASMIAARDILNTGGSINSNGDLSLTASRDISNISGSIAGRRVALNAGRDILNSTASQRFENTEKGEGGSSGNNGLLASLASLDPRLGGYTTLIGNIGSIRAIESLSINAGRDLTLIGSTVNAANDATLSAGRNLTVTTLAAASGTRSSIGGNFSTDQLTQLTGSIQSGGNLLMKSGADLQLTSATLDVGKNATLIAGGNLTLDTAKNTTSHDYTAGRNIDRAYDETVLGSNLKAGGNLLLAATSGKGEQAKGSVNLLSANLTSDTGRLQIVADNTVNIGVTDEQHTSFKQTHNESSGLFSSSSTDTQDAIAYTNAIGSSLSGSNIAIQTGKDLNITGSQIVAQNDIVLAAANDINISAATNTRSEDHYSHTSSSGFQLNDNFLPTNQGPDITSKSHLDSATQSLSKSLIQSKNGNLIAEAGNNLIIAGSDLQTDIQAQQSRGQINLKAGNVIALLSGTDTLSETRSTDTITQTSLISKQKRSIATTSDTTASFGTSLTGNAINLQSGADTLLQGTQLNAGTGGINIDAGNDIKLLAAYTSTDTSRHETLVTDGINFGTMGTLDWRADRARDKTNTRQTQTAQVTQLASAGNITTHSNGNTILQGTDLVASGSIDLSAGTDTRNSTILIQGAKSAEASTEQNQSSTDFWQNASGRGDSSETLKLANIKAGKGLTVSATGGIEVELPKAQPAAPNGLAGIATAPLTPEQQAVKNQADLNQQLDTLASQPGQEWIGQLAKRDNATFNQVKLAAEHWDYSHEGLTPAGAAVVVLAVTYMSGGTASSAAASIAGTGTVTAAALAAGMTTLASQAAVSLINNQGDMGKTLNDLGKSENIKALALSMATAGVLQGLDNKLSVGGTSLNDINTQSSTYTQQLSKAVINNATTAVINTAVNGGNLEDNLRESLKTALIDTAAANVAKNIGDLEAGDKINAFTHKFAHAVAGCAAGAAKAGDCSSGALGAVVGEIAAELYAPKDGTPLTPQQKTDTINFSKLMAGVAAAITGEDANAVNLAASAGGNAAENNYLNHDQSKQLGQELSACKQRGCSTDEQRAIASRWKATSDQQQEEFIQETIDTGSEPNPKALYYVAKVPFSTGVENGAAQDIISEIDSQNSTVKWTSISELAALAVGGLAGFKDNVNLPSIGGARGNGVVNSVDKGLAGRGFIPPVGTRSIPDGVPDTWRIRPTEGAGGVWYYDPTNKGNAVRVMPGNPASPFPNSQVPYVRWQQNGVPLDVNGNNLPNKNSPDAHIPLENFKFKP